MDTKRTAEKTPGILWGLLSQPIKDETQRWKTCLLATFAFGLVAHGYGFLNFTINHDSMREFYLSISMRIKISAGRFLQPLVRSAMGEIMTFPWLTGLMGLLFIGLAVYVMSKMFSLNKVWENLLLAGICVTNVTVTAIVASYIHDFCGNMLALLLSVCAAYLWHKMKEAFSWKNTLLGGICLWGTLGVYQSYIAVSITLMCLDSILDLMKGSPAKTVVKRLLWAIPMGVWAAATWYICVKQTLLATGIAMRSDVQNVTNIWSKPEKFLRTVGREYGLVLQDLLVPNVKESMQGVFGPMAFVICRTNAVLMLVDSAIILAVCRKKSVNAWACVLIILLILILPLCMLCVNIFSAVDHNLTRYAVFLFYLIVLVLFKCFRETVCIKQNSWQMPLLLCMIGLIMFSNVQMSNTAYIRKDAERQATLFTLTRVVSRLEAYEDYKYKESEVALIGDFGEDNVVLQSGAVDRIVGVSYRSQITNPNVMKRYFEVVLQYPINLNQDKSQQIRDTMEFQQMGVFPERDSIATIDGVIVVKLSE